MYVLLSLLHKQIFHYVQNLQTSDHNANIKGFMQAFAKKDLKENMWKYEMYYVHIHHCELCQTGFSSCKHKKKKKAIDL